MKGRCVLLGIIDKIQGVLTGIKEHPLTRENRRYKSLVERRFIGWQLSKYKYSKSGKIVDWINQLKLIMYPGRASATGNFYYGLMEYEQMSFLWHYLDESDVFFDIGANIGAYTVLAINSGKVVSFEPAEDTVKVLQENIRLNRMDNVMVVQKGVSDFSGTMHFTNGLDSTNHLVESEDGSTVTIETVKLDSFIAEHRVFPTVLKIDAEGAEERIVLGAKNVLNDSRVRAIVMEIFGDEEKSKLIEKYGFTLCGYNPKERRLYKTTAREAGRNGIYIRDLDYVNDKVLEGKPIVYRGIRLD